MPSMPSFLGNFFLLCCAYETYRLQDYQMMVRKKEQKLNWKYQKIEAATQPISNSTKNIPVSIDRKMLVCLFSETNKQAILVNRKLPLRPYVIFSILSSHIKWCFKCFL